MVRVKQMMVLLSMKLELVPMEPMERLSMRLGLVLVRIELDGGIGLMAKELQSVAKNIPNN